MFLDKGAEKKDFFYMYDHVFIELHVTLPFNDWVIGILLVLNVAHSQWNPNG